MPVHEVDKGRWQFGKSGKVYNSKEKAIKQGLAIMYSQAKKQGKAAPTQAEVSSEVFGKSASALAKLANTIMYSQPAEAITSKDTKYTFNDVITNAHVKLGKNSVPQFGTAVGEFDIASAPYTLLGQKTDPKTGKVVKTLHTALDTDAPIMDDALESLARLYAAQTPEYRGKVSKRELNQYVDTIKNRLADVTAEKRVALKLSKGKIDREALKLIGPSYLGFGLAGMLIGRLIAGNKNKWWGYGLGGIAGLGLNYLRRRYTYGGNVVV